MTKVTFIDPSSGNHVVKGALEKLAAYAAELGLAVAQEGSWRYDAFGQHLDLKVRFTVGGTEGVEAKRRVDFELAASYFGLEADDYGAELVIKRKRYRLVRINTRRNVAYPFECDSVDGGRGIRLPEIYKHQIIAMRSARK